MLNTENKQLEQCLNTKDVLDINQQSHNGTCQVVSVVRLLSVTNAAHLSLDDMNENITKFVADFEKMHDQVNEVDQELKQHPGGTYSRWPTYATQLSHILTILY